MLGSIPTGFLAAKAKGIDIRSVGSGNIGATNAMRVLGKPIGIAVLLLDALKGYLAVWLCAVIAGIMLWLRWYITHSEPDSTMPTRISVNASARKFQPPSDLVFICRK